MDVRKKLGQYSTLIIGLMIGGGFAFGGIASYAGMIDTSGSQQRANYSMPGSYYTEGTFGLNYSEQRALAYRNDVVFVNVLYSTSGQRQELSFLEGLSSGYNGRVYVQVTNASAGSLVTSRFGLTSYPSAVVVGGARNGVKIVRDVNPESVGDAVCGVMRSWDSLAAKCQVR